MQNKTPKYFSFNTNDVTINIYIKKHNNQNVTSTLRDVTEIFTFSLNGKYFNSPKSRNILKQNRQLPQKITSYYIKMPQTI